jgi:hypothetical protein
MTRETERTPSLQQVRRVLIRHGLSKEVVELLLLELRQELLQEISTDLQSRRATYGHQPPEASSFQSGLSSQEIDSLTRLESAKNIEHMPIETASSQVENELFILPAEMGTGISASIDKEYTVITILGHEGPADIRATGHGTIDKIAQSGRIFLLGPVRWHNVIIVHANTRKSVYSGLSKVFVKPGDQVHTGDIIGRLRGGNLLFFSIQQELVNLDLRKYIATESLKFIVRKMALYDRRSEEDFSNIQLIPSEETSLSDGQEFFIWPIETTANVGIIAHRDELLVFNRDKITYVRAAGHGAIHYIDGSERKLLLGPATNFRVRIKHANEIDTIYTGLYKVLVKSGDQVQAGDIIGILRNAGQLTFTIKKGAFGDVEDLRKYLPKRSDVQF